MSEVEQTLLAAAGQFFEVEAESIALEDDFFQKFGINSLQALNLLTQIEKTFDVEIPDYELQGVTTFKALAAIIEERKV